MYFANLPQVLPQYYEKRDNMIHALKLLLLCGLENEWKLKKDFRFYCKFCTAELLVPMVDDFHE